MEFLSFISEITLSSPVRQILGDQIFFAHLMNFCKPTSLHGIILHNNVLF
jgi:hypothetical protein